MAREVSLLAGIQHHTFDLATKTVTVVYDPRQVAEQQVRDAITRANAAMAASPQNPRNPPG